MTSDAPESDAALVSRAAVALAALMAAAREAGEIALKDFRFGVATSAHVHYKDATSPVSSADLAVDAFLKRKLSEAFPDAGWLSEETADDPSRLGRAELIVADPIDGTRAYISGDPRWAIALAFVVEGHVVAGVVHAPALQETFAASLGAGATLNGAKIRASNRQSLVGARIGGPRSLVAAVAKAAGTQFVTEPRIPSLAYRLARVAAGSLDLAIASANAHDWDIAAADILLAEAGAGLRGAHGERLSYNGEETRRETLAAAPMALMGEFVAALAAAMA